MVAPRTLRVAVDATPLLGHRTGVGAFVEGALAALARQPGLDLRAYALSLRGGRSLPRHLPDGARTLSRPMPATALLTAWARADRPPGEWWTGPVDVVHGTNFVCPPSRGAEVVTVHDLGTVRHPEWATAGTRRFAPLVRRALRRGAFVHTPSAFVAAEVVELLGADPSRVRPVASGVPALAGGGVAPVSGPYVLALGNVEARKALPTLVQAFDAIAGADRALRLVVAGPPGPGDPALAEAVQRSSHRDRVVRLGWVAGPTRAALLREASVLAFPSLYEGFGFPPLEAMSVGVPVVATRAGSLPEVLGDGAHLVPPGDADALAEGLALVLGDRELRAALVARGARQAAAFSWESCGAGLAELYRHAADAR